MARAILLSVAAAMAAVTNQITAILRSIEVNVDSPKLLTSSNHYAGTKRIKRANPARICPDSNPFCMCVLRKYRYSMDFHMLVLVRVTATHPASRLHVRLT